MIHSFAPSIYAMFAERTVLLLNHLLAAEPAATQRLCAHAGCCIQLHFRGGASWLPALPTLSLGITRAGLLEQHVDRPSRAADLRVTVDATHPGRVAAQWLTGVRPAVEVQGEVRLAADVNWLVQNLRWDVQDDLERVVGPVAACEIARLGSALAAGLHKAVNTLSDRAARVPAGAVAPAPR